MAETTIDGRERCATVTCDRCGAFVHLEKVYLSATGKLCGGCMARQWFTRLFWRRDRRR